MCGNRRNNVGGDFDDNNFKVKVHSHIDGRDFCRGVRRCLSDLLDDADDRRHDNGCRRQRNNNCWF
jgi:hypothetical protein